MIGIAFVVGVALCAIGALLLLPLFLGSFVHWLVPSIETSTATLSIGLGMVTLVTAIGIFSLSTLLYRNTEMITDELGTYAAGDDDQYEHEDDQRKVWREEDIDHLAEALVQSLEARMGQRVSAPEFSRKPKHRK
ncbi:MAG: hypothetical protein FJ267_06970 [Planctomycetes bacterium]|nr:hypothetical protein [Planctomycetota bacterium]